jgi:hypothetical protein
MFTYTDDLLPQLSNINFSKIDQAYTIVAVDSVRKLALVTSTKGERLHIPFSRGGIDIQGAGDFSIPPSGRAWRAIVDKVGEQLIIVGCIPVGIYNTDDKQLLQSVGSERGQDPFDSITESLQEFRSYATQATTNKQNFRLNSFYDTIPGDYGYRGLDGNWFGILRGGVNIFSASSLNKILQFQEDDLLRLISRNYDNFSDAGVIKSTNVNGKTRLFLGLNSGTRRDFKTEEEKYEVEIEIGQCQKFKEDTFIFTLEYKPKGLNPFTLTIDKQGSLQIFGSKDIFQSSQEETAQVARNWSVFAEDSIKMDAKKTISLAAGATATINKDTGEVTLNQDGMHLEMDGNKVKAGAVGQTKQVVTKPHLDNYGHLVQAVAQISAFLGGVGASELAQAVDLLNHTNNFEGS